MSAILSEATMLELEEVKARLAEAEEIIRAIRDGEIDALVVSSPQGERVYTLKTADHPYRLLVEQMQQGAAMLDAGGRVVFCNARFGQILRVQSDRVLRAPSVLEFVVDQDRHFLQSLMDRALHGAAGGEVTLRAGDQSLVPVYLLLNHFAQVGDGDGICMLVTDLSEQRANEALRDRERQFRLLFESNPEPMWVFDRDTLQFLAVNDAAIRQYGYTRDEFLSMTVAEIRPSEEVARFKERHANISRRLAHGTIDRAGVWIHRKKDGPLIEVEITSTPIQFGGHDSALVAAIDVTDRQRNEASLRDSDRRKDEFLGMLAHELRNPLAVISSAIDVLNRAGPSETQSAKLREMIRRQTQNLTRMIDDLLDVSRISRGKIILSKEIVDLGTIVGRAVESVRPLIEFRKHELIVSIGAESMRLEADPVRVEQMLVNLLTNAAKYTEPGGCIRLFAERADSHIVVRVQDNGIGIDEEMLPRIFDLFTQADTSLCKSQGGLGIGLALVHNLVELHGGIVTAHSHGKGQGSEFIVRLPGLHSQALLARPASTPHASNCPACVKVLVVDDNVEVADSIRMLLDALGHRACVVHSGTAALKLLRQGTGDEKVRYVPDLVLVDIGMPDMNGFELASRLRAEPDLAKLRLVALTGYGRPGDRQRACDAGFDDHLVKPIRLPTLEAILAAARPSTDPEQDMS